MVTDQPLYAPSGWTGSLAQERERLHTPSTAARVADLIRTQVLDGRLGPDVQLAEEALVAALGVSRNTIREGLQILIHEHLVVRKPHRGVFVRRLSKGELANLCGLRRALECGAVREAAARDVPPHQVQTVLAAAQDGVRSAASQDWAAVGTMNSRFHVGLAALSGNPRIEMTVTSLLAELRLAFLVVADAQAMHEPYVAVHVTLAEQVAAGHLLDAAAELEAYLHRSQRHLITAYAEATTPSP